MIVNSVFFLALVLLLVSSVVLYFLDVFSVALQIIQLLHLLLAAQLLPLLLYFLYKSIQAASKKRHVLGVLNGYLLVTILLLLCASGLAKVITYPVFGMFLNYPLIHLWITMVFFTSLLLQLFLFYQNNPSHRFLSFFNDEECKVIVKLSSITFTIIILVYVIGSWFMSFSIVEEGKSSSLSSSACYACHTTEFDQWKSSAHAATGDNKHFLLNLNKASEEEKTTCNACHQPLLKVSNSQNKSVSCDACHTDGGDKKHAVFLFSGDEFFIKESLYHFLIKANIREHKRQYLFIESDSSGCISCHSISGIANNQQGFHKSLTINTSDLTTDFLANNACISCHGKSSEGLFDHAMIGGRLDGSVQHADFSQLNKVRDYLRSNRVRLTIIEPRRKDATQDLLAINELIRTNTQTPFYVYLNEHVNLDVMISNIGVGHDFPGGDMHFSRVWVSFMVTDGVGSLIHEENLAEEEVSNNNYAYFLSEKIKHNASKVYKLSFSVPAWVKTPLSVTAQVHYQDFNDQLQPLKAVDMARKTLLIPVKIQHEVQ